MKNNKSLGQHWLKNREILNEIADLAAYGGSDDEDLEEHAEVAKVCLEIGPGLGTLTSSLLKRFDKVIAVEFDKRLAVNLPKSFPGKNLEVINADILEFDYSTIDGKYVIAGNIPYYITSPIIEKVLTAKHKPERVVLLIQKEVAERILSGKETVLSLFVKNLAKVYAGSVVLKDEFTPPPKVDSQVIVMEPLNEPVVSDEVFSLIRTGFKAPRKKLLHNLSGLKSREGLLQIFAELGIDENVRPGDLGLEKWAELHKVLQAKK